MTTATPGLTPGIDARAKRNALVLSAAQAFYNLNGATVMNLGAIIGASMLFDKSNATLPITTMSIGTMLATVPASLFMQQYGRRLGLQLGALIGFVGSLLAAWAVYRGEFGLFCAATFLIGLFQSSAQFYRFAATDTASPEFRPRAISWVLAGGLVAALFVPGLISVTKDYSVPFAGCFLATAVASLATLLVLSLLEIPPPERTSSSDTGRPLAEIAAQPRFIGAVVAGMIAFGMMSLAMTATPLAMLGCGFSLDQSTSTIRWHVLAMFAPSFFTGDLIARFGKERIVLVGLGLLALAGVFAIAGIAAWNFTISLILLGLGWNFGYIGATAIVTDCHTPAERGKVQALNDLLVFGFVTLATWLSGYMFHAYGWAALNGLLLAAVAIGTVAVLYARRGVAKVSTNGV
jgi:MFS family permease